MQNCEFKKGIFIQRTCGNPAYHQCKNCNTSVCSTHSRAIANSNNEVLCHACFIAENNIDENQARISYLESNSNFSLWYSSYRIEHEHSHENLVFDENDYNDFDANSSNQQVYLDDDNDFFDS